MDRRGTSAETQRRTKARTEPCPATEGRPDADRLSALSDELLLRILSFIGIRRAITTSRLSRRWRYLYHHLPSLDFSSRGWDELSGWFIDRVLLLHAAPRIELFRLSMRVASEGEGEGYSEHRQIDSRLLFAVRRGVRALDLDIQVEDPDNRHPDEASYRLPPWVFQCRTLEDFSLRHCHLLILDYQIRLVSLKKMRLCLTKVHKYDLRRLLVGCPLLQSLELAYCNEMSDVVIDARENRNLEELVIVDEVDDHHSSLFSAEEMQIYAPSVKYLTFKGVAFRRQYEVRDLSSLVAASFLLDGRSVLYEEEADVFTTGLLLRIPQVQVLKLCSLSLEALCISELRGNLISALPGVTRLELIIGLEETELQAILSALHVCSNLRKLVLSIRQQNLRMMVSYDSDSDETESPRLFALDSDIVMHDLKSIIIQGLTRYDEDRAEEGSESEDFVAEKEENDIVLIGFLLKVSPVLEKLTVQLSMGMNTTAKKWELLFNLSSDLLSLPRASPKAQGIIIDQK